MLHMLVRKYFPGLYSKNLHKFIKNAESPNVRIQVPQIRTQPEVYVNLILK